MTQSFPVWLPDWAVAIGDADRARGDATEGEPPSISHLRPPDEQLNPDKGSISSGLPSSHAPETTSDQDPRDAPVRKERTVAVTPNQDRTVHRKLQGIHLFVSLPKYGHSGAIQGPFRGHS